MYLRLNKSIKYFFNILISITFLIFSFNLSPANSADKPLKKVIFIPHWSPQAQFAGYYVAYEKGIYKKYGLDVQIIEGGPNRSPCEFLKSGKADFATFWLSTGIKERAEGVEFVNIAQVMQKSALMLVAKKRNGIKKPQDMNSKKVGLWGPIFQIQPRAFFKKHNLKVEIIPQSYSVNLFLRDGVDVASAMLYNEYHTIISAGYDPEELTTFFFYDYGLNFPEDGIYTLQKTYEKDPKLSCAFAQASLQGWKYAFDNPQEALAIVLKYMEKAHIAANRVHQQWMLERMKDLILGDHSQEDIGRLQPQDYYRVAEQLKSDEMIGEVPDFNAFYKKCYSNDEK
jgi:NitT/TauT family transport system substrate-binding protein